MKRIIAGLSLVASCALMAQTVQIPQGWTNLGVASDSVLDELRNSNIDLVWRYNNNTWEVFSPDEDMMSLIQNDVNSGNVGYGVISSTISQGDALWIHATESTTLHLGLSSLDANVFGVVKDAITNSLIPDVNVTVYNRSGEVVDGLTLQTDSNGSFRLEGIPGGIYTVGFSAEDYNDLNISSAVYTEEFNLGQIRLIPDTSSMILNVQGSLINAVNGSVVEGARVILRPGFNNTESSDTQSDTVTDSSGSFSLMHIPAGQYTVIIRQNGYYDTIENITVFAESGETTATRNFSITPQLAENEILRAKLDWGLEPSDLDSHLVSYNEQSQSVNWHMYYGNRTPEGSNGNLDLDDTSSYGPETITLNAVDTNSTYKYFVYNFSGDYGGLLKDSEARLSIVYNGRTYTSEVPYEDGLVWKVFEIRNGVFSLCQENCVMALQPYDYEGYYNMRPTYSIDTNILREIEADISSNSK